MSAPSPVGADPATAAVKHAQVTYHDWEARSYDDKWSISFDQRCIDYALGRFRKTVPDWDGTPYRRVLEVGCGTGFFLLNLAQAGVVGEAHCTDLSPGMVDTCRRNGARLGVDVVGRVADVEALPYDDATFDLVLGHAFVHHVPNLDVAFAELRRVLRPGGRLVVAGEPTQLGDRIANQVKRAARIGVKLAATVAGTDRVLAEQHAELHPADRAAAALEHEVDLHLFTPGQLEALATRAGFTDVATVTEELTANWFGWATRTVEAMLRPGLLPAGYPWFAYRTWQRLFAFDETVARRLVPKDAFYNCILTATAPPQPKGPAAGV
ncbi:MAG: methyltransferase domain-containing protein [Actinomycetota bacterium]|nr:methyltransferase domain-containing protein [Actinomycetota bacterium]